VAGNGDEVKLRGYGRDEPTIILGEPAGVTATMRLLPWR